MLLVVGRAVLAASEAACRFVLTMFPAVSAVLSPLILDRMCSASTSLMEGRWQCGFSLVTVDPRVVSRPLQAGL